MNRKCPSRCTFFPSGNELKTTYETQMSSTLIPYWEQKKMSLVRKVSTRLYFLRQLKKSHVATRELLLFYITCIRSILEYGSPVFHAKALELSRLLTLYDRRGAIAAKLFDEICANQSLNLQILLPRKYQPSYSLREQRTFIRPKRKTERCKNSFLLSYVYSS